MVDPKVLKAYVESSGLSYKQNSISYIFTCPRCNKDQKLFLRKRDAKFICFYCSTTEGFRGRGEYCLAELLSIPVKVVQEKLYGAVSQESSVILYPDLQDFFGDDEITEEPPELPALQWDHNCHPIDHPHSKRGLQYLEGRGIPLEVARQYNLRYIPQERRVVFPVEMGDKLLGYQKRTIIPDKVWNEEQGRYLTTAKILSSTGIPRERALMFSNRLAGQKHAILTEGPIDAIKCHAVGGGNVCAMGKLVSRGQINLLRNHGIHRIYLALDPDAAEETSRLVREFSDIEVYLMQPTGKDLGEMSFEDVRELFLEAPRVSPSQLFVFLRRWHG